MLPAKESCFFLELILDAWGSRTRILSLNNRKSWRQELVMKFAHNALEEIPPGSLSLQILRKNQWLQFRISQIKGISISPWMEKTLWWAFSAFLSSPWRHLIIMTSLDTYMLQTLLINGTECAYNVQALVDPTGEKLWLSDWLHCHFVESRGERGQLNRQASWTGRPVEPAGQLNHSKFPTRYL